MIYLAFAVQILFMLGLPVVLAVLLWWRWGLRWKLFWVGCLTFVGSQVVHIPMLIVEKLGLQFALVQLGVPLTQAATMFPVILADAILLGLMAGLCEEPARYLGYRLLLRGERRWRESLMFGVGHGGIESVLMGLIVLINVVVILWLTSADLASLGITGLAETQVRQAIDELVNAPLYTPFLGALERLWAICIQVGMTVLVWRTVTTRRWRYFLTAIGWHWLVDAATVLVLSLTQNVLVTEAMVTGFGLLSLGFVWWSRRWGVEEPVGQ